MKVNNTVLIGLTGIAGSGKDTISSMVAEYLTSIGQKSESIAFADPLKEAAALIFNVPLTHFYDRSLKEVKIPFWEMSPRQMAQKLGTDACRKSIRDDIWVKRALSTISDHTAKGIDVIFVTDVRFDNEAAMIRDSGGYVVQIIREGQVKIADSSHESESGVDHTLVDATIRNMNGNPFNAASALNSLIADWSKV